MKKIIIGTALLATVIGSGAAFAEYGNGHNKGRYHSGYTMDQGQGCGMRGMKSEEMQKFHSENTALFKQMTEKRAELQALTMASTPDIAKVGTVAGELFDVQMKVHDAAIAADLPGKVQNKKHRKKMDETTRAKMVEFNKENRDLKKQLVVKQAERRALLNMASPSPEQAKALAGEIFDIRTSLSVKAEESGVPVQLACATMGGNRHNGMHLGDMDNNSKGKGRHKGGHWN